MFVSLVIALVGCQDYSIGDRLPPTADVDDTDLPTPTPPTPVDTDAPVAVCSVSPNPVTPPFEAASFDGSASTDPQGLPLTYDWQLTEKPTGSAVSMPAGGAVRSNFVPDLAGLYVGRLVVTNSAGVSSPACEAELEAIPAQDLWVEMYWDQAGDDMDLHLLAPGGAPRTNTDCYYANCRNGLDWGVQGSSLDDPRLDVDDIAGTGPENINIDQPAPGGGYTVMVHDYPGFSDPTSPTNVTVNVYLNGQLAWTDTRAVAGEDTDTYFAVIDWQAGTVTGL